MLKHIVMWKLKDEALGAGKQANAIKMKEMLEALPATIEEIRELEVGISIDSDDPQSADVVLVSAFNCGECLKSYAIHPHHLEVVAFVKQVAAERRVIDYEL